MFNSINVDSDNLCDGLHVIALHCEFAQLLVTLHSQSMVKLIINPQFCGIYNRGMSPGIELKDW